MQCNHPTAWAIQSCRPYNVRSINGRKRCAYILWKGMMLVPIILEFSMLSTMLMFIEPS